MKRTIVWLVMICMLLGTGLGCKRKDGGAAFKDVPLETILDSIYREANIELPERGTVEITQENMSYYLGTDELEFSEAIASEALLNVVPFSLCLLRVSDPKKAQDAAKLIAENADPNKWICVSVSGDHVLTDYAGDVVMLVMAEQSNELHAAFKRLAKA